MAATPDPALDAPDAPARCHTQRSDGWTPERQRGFLERIAEGATVDEASASVGLSPGAAYALRRRAAGGAFALGWDAARHVARPLVAEALFRRAIDGQVDRLTRADGEVIERHRYDNRLALALLARLDRHAEAEDGANAAARLVAAEFEPFLDLLGSDGATARAGQFLCARIRADLSGGAEETTQAPLATLARADHWLRTGAALRSELDTSDLDPAARAGWTAEQWARAEAAGLLRLAPEPEPEPEITPLEPEPDPAPASALSILRTARYEDPPAWTDKRVWYDFDVSAWRTSFPPPPDFFGFENSEFGEDAYYRACTDEEEIILEAPHLREVAERTVTESAERDAWFVEYALDDDLMDDAYVEAAGATDAARIVALARVLDPDRAFDAACAPSPARASSCNPPPAAEPEPPIRRSPAIHCFTDGTSHEHLRQDQIGYLR